MSKATRSPLLAASLCMILQGATLTLTGALLPAIVADLHLTTAQASLLVTSPAVGYVIAATLAGMLGDRLGFRFVWLLGVGGGIITLLAIALAPSGVALVVAVGAVGMVAGFCDGSIDPLLALLYPERSGSILNRVHLFFGVGATLTPLLVGLGLRLELPWRGHYALLTIFAALVIAAILRATIPYNLHLKREQALPVHKLFTTRIVVLAALAMFLYGAAENSILSWSALYLTSVRTVTVSTASAAVSAFGITLLVGRLISGQVVERTGYRGLVMGGAILGAVGLALMITLPGVAAPWAGLALSGLGLAGIFATIIADVTRRSPGHTGAVAGLVLSIGGVGKIMGPWLVGLIAQATNLTGGLGLAVGLAVLMALVYSLT